MASRLMALKRLDVCAGLTNLFERSYYQAISSIDSGNAFGEPRNAVLTAKYTF